MEKSFKRKFIPILTALAVIGVSVALYFFQLFAPIGTPIYTGAFPKQPGELRIHFVDVGQGDCEVVELPDGKLMVIDGGNDLTDQAQKVYRYVKALGYDKVDYLIVSHSDEDHFAGLIYLTQNMSIGTAYLPFTTGKESAKYTSFRLQLAKKTTVIMSQIYQTIEGENYYCTFLSPHSKESYLGEFADTNDLSAVMWLDYHGVDALFCGDITTTVENQLLREWQIGKELGENMFSVNGREVDLESTEILKVAHHGSGYSTSAKWLDTLGVETAIISSGVENAYGHPAPTLLERLGNAGAEIYRTDECGSIIISISSQGTYRVEYENQK